MAESTTQRRYFRKEKHEIKDYSELSKELNKPVFPELKLMAFKHVLQYVAEEKCHVKTDREKTIIKYVLKEDSPVMLYYTTDWDEEAEIIDLLDIIQSKNIYLPGIEVHAQKLRSFNHSTNQFPESSES